MSFRTADRLIMTAVMAGTSLFPVMAQSLSTEQQEPVNPVEMIEETSGGNVEIDIPGNILEEILKEEKKKGAGERQLVPGINKMPGYRIQVFSDGRNQHSLESRARARGNAIVARFPKYRGQVYTFSSAPNWYARVGNFRSQEEAASALAELKRAFPQFASEMRVVRSRIVVVK